MPSGLADQPRRRPAASETRSRVEEEQEDARSRTSATREPPHRIVADRLDELVGDTRLAERPQRRGLGELLGREPVAEDLERPDVAGDADRRRASSGARGSRPAAPARSSCSIGRSAPSPRTARRRIIRYHSRVLAAAPSAAFAARNRSTARPSVRCPPESGAHRFGVAESGAQRSGESGAQFMIVASCDGPRTAFKPRDVVLARWCRPQHLVVLAGEEGFEPSIS